MTVKELRVALARCVDSASVIIQVDSDEAADVTYVHCDFAADDVNETVTIHGTT